MHDDEYWNDERWDEDKWEQYLRENDRRVDRCMELMDDFLRRHPRPDDRDAEALARWKTQLRAYVDDRGWTPDDLALPFLLLGDENEGDDPLFDEPPLSDDVFEGDGFFGDGLFLDDAESGSDAAFEEHFDSFRQLPVYQQGMALAGTVIEWSHALPAGVKDGALVQFCSLIMQVPAKVAKGHALGFEQDMIGGNIACVKRSLGVANEALDLLGRIKARPYLDDEVYRQLYEDLYEMRNALGLYVQELRARFDLGID